MFCKHLAFANILKLKSLSNILCLFQSIETEASSEEVDESELSGTKSASGEASKAAVLNGLRRRSTRRSIKKSETEDEDLEVQTVQPVSILLLEIRVMLSLQCCESYFISVVSVP